MMFGVLSFTGVIPLSITNTCQSVVPCTATSGQLQILGVSFAGYSMLPVPGSQAVVVTSGPVTVQYVLAYAGGMFTSLKTSTASDCVATASQDQSGNWNQCTPSSSLSLSQNSFNSANGVGTLVSPSLSAQPGQVIDVKVTLSDGTTTTSETVAIHIVANSYTYTVQVDDPNGAGIAGATVLLGTSSTDTVSWHNPYANATANSGGLATFQVAYGSYPYAVAYAKNFQQSGTQSTPFVLGAASGTTMKITLQPVSYTVIVNVKGTCSVGNGQTGSSNLAGATVTLSNGKTMTTDGGGNAQFTGLTAGSLTGTASASGYGSVSIPSFDPSMNPGVLTVSLSTSNSCNSVNTSTSNSTSTSGPGSSGCIPAGQDASILVTVDQNGTPASGAAVIASTGSAGGNQVGSGTTGTNGQVCINGLAVPNQIGSDQGTIYVTATLGSASSSVQVTVTQGQASTALVNLGGSPNFNFGTGQIVGVVSILAGAALVFTGVRRKR